MFCWLRTLPKSKSDVSPISGVLKTVEKWENVLGVLVAVVVVVVVVVPWVVVWCEIGAV